MYSDTFSHSGISKIGVLPKTDGVIDQMKYNLLLTILIALPWFIFFVFSCPVVLEVLEEVNSIKKTF